MSNAVSNDDTGSVRSINIRAAFNSLAATVDAQQRSEQALKDHPEFFNAPAHQKRINDVLDIVHRFFPICNKVYVNHRANRGKPFTAVKVERPTWPAKLSSNMVDDIYRKPLAALGVEIIYSKNTNSYLYHVP